MAPGVTSEDLFCLFNTFLKGFTLGLRYMLLVKELTSSCLLFATAPKSGRISLRMTKTNCSTKAQRMESSGECRVIEHATAVKMFRLI